MTTSAGHITRAVGLTLGLAFASVAGGMVAGNIAMYGTSYLTSGKAPETQAQPASRVVAALSGLVGAGIAGFALGRRRTP